MYPTSFPGLGHGRRAVSGAGSVTAADVGLILDCSGTFALTFAAAATLGNQFQVAFYVSSGTVTLTGNGAETIQSPAGSANTFVLTAGQGAYVSCDGTGLKIVLGVGLAPAPATTVVTDTIQAATTAGLLIKNSSGTQVASFGLTGTGVIFAGAVTVNGGTLTAGTVDVNGGAIDGTPIGASSASTGAFTTLTTSSTAGFGGAVTCSSTLTVPNGSAASPGLRVAGEVHGLYRATANELGIAVSGSASAGFNAPDGSTQGGTLRLYSPTAAEPIAITNGNISTSFTVISGSTGVAFGGQVRAYGHTHATKASFVEINDGTTTNARFDTDSTAGNTRFLIYDVDNGTLERVSVGAADSGGTGYKVLRIPN